MERALEIDPLSTTNRVRYADHLVCLGRYDDAFKANMRYFNRPGPPEALLALVRLEEARPVIEQEVENTPTAPRSLGHKALLLALSGQAEAVGRLIPEIQKGTRDRGYHHAAEMLACVFAIQGKVSEAVQWLRTCAATGMPNYLLFSRDPHLHKIRRSAEFERFMAEMRTTWDGYRQRYT